MSDNIIQLNEDLIKQDLKSLVRSSVEETLNALLDHEAEELVNAEKYEHSGDRKGYRSGHYNRNFQTTAGDVTLKVPKLKGVQFETAIIERYRRRECSVEEALIEMYLAGVSVRRVEDITEALWGTKVSPGTISNLNKKAYEHIETWRTRPLTDEYPYIYVDYYWLRRLREDLCEMLPAATAVCEKPVEFKRLEVQTHVPGTQAAVIIRLNGATVEVNEGTSQQTIQAVLLALQSVC